jgi:hypothetical protein
MEINKPNYINEEGLPVDILVGDKLTSYLKKYDINPPKSQFEKKLEDGKLFIDQLPYDENKISVIDLQWKEEYNIPLCTFLENRRTVDITIKEMNEKTIKLNDDFIKFNRKAVSFIEKEIGNNLLTIDNVKYINILCTGSRIILYYPNEKNIVIKKQSYPLNTFEWRSELTLLFYHTKDLTKITDPTELSLFKSYREISILHEKISLDQNDTSLLSILHSKTNLFLSKYDEPIREYFYKAEANNIEDYMNYFILCWNSSSSYFLKSGSNSLSSLLYHIAFLHNFFVLIHPCSIGNGRTIRLLCNLLLIKSNHKPFWFSTIQQYKLYDNVIVESVRRREKDFILPFYKYLCNLYDVEQISKPTNSSFIKQKWSELTKHIMTIQLKSPL